MPSKTVNAIQGVQDEDIVIAFMGPTGAGKSYFIDLLTGQQGRRAGSSLMSVTSEVEATRVEHPTYGNRIVLVDTPGFNDTTMSDMEVLQKISSWLEKTYRKEVKLSGLVYLHRINARGMNGSARKNIRMFGEICGDVAMKQVILVTTMWKDVRLEEGEMREEEIKEKFWKSLTDNGAKVDRLERSDRGEAWRIVNRLISETDLEREAVLLQEELVELGKQLNETQAGRALHGSLQTLLAKRKEDLKGLLAHAKKSNDPVLKKLLQEEYDKTDAEIQKMSRDLKQLKISFGKRIKLYFFGKEARANAVKVLSE